MQIQPQQIDVEVEYEDPEELMRKKAEKLQSFGSSLGGQRDEWIRSRGSYGVDKRWIEDEDQYNGKDNINKAASQMMTSVEQGYPVTTQGAKPHRSTVFIGMTRQKTNAAEARLADILLPTDDRNWGIQPTPDPELMGMSKDNKAAMDQQGQPIMGEDGQPARVRDVVKAVREQANKKAKGQAKAKIEVLGTATKPEEILAAYKLGEWNELRIVANGQRLQHYLNGKLSADVTDTDATAGAKDGVIALQLHQGPPMTIQFKDVHLKTLP